MKKLLSFLFAFILITSNLFAGTLEIDWMETLTSDAVAQLAYVTSDTTTYTSQYPPEQSATYVKATTEYDPPTFGMAFRATNPAMSLTGANTNEWVSANGSYTNQRFHIDLGSAKTITKIYYENGHHNGTDTNHGVQNFTLWGSNTAAAFAELTYGTDTNWTQLTTGQSTFDQHTASDIADPKYITVTNTTAYRYYAFKFPDTWGATGYMEVRRIELQTLTPVLQSYSEATIKTQGSYALKAVATTGAINKTLTKTFAVNSNLTGVKNLWFDTRASRTGSNFKIGLHDTGGTTTEITPNIITADTYQKVNWDWSAVSDANKDNIDTCTVTVTNADSANTIYLDYHEIAQAIDVFGWVN